MTEKIQINLRLKAETIERIEKEAERQNRSRNNLIEVIIEEYLKLKEQFS